MTTKRLLLALSVVADVTAVWAALGTFPALVVYVISAIAAASAIGAFATYIRESRPGAAVLGAVLLAVAVAVAVFTAAGGLDRLMASPPPAPPPLACNAVPSRPTEEAPLTPLASDNTSPVTIDHAYYHVTHGRPPEMEVTGSLHGSFQPGHLLYLVKYPETYSRDQLGNRGSGGYYPVGPMVVKQGCWSFRQLPAGYDDASGIVYRHILVDATQQQADELDAFQRLAKNDRRRIDGLSNNDLAAVGATLLASFDVPTG